MALFAPLSAPACGRCCTASRTSGGSLRPAIAGSDTVLPVPRQRRAVHAVLKRLLPPSGPSRVTRLHVPRDLPTAAKRGTGGQQRNSRLPHRPGNQFPALDHQHHHAHGDAHAWRCAREYTRTCSQGARRAAPARLFPPAGFPPCTPLPGIPPPKWKSGRGKTLLGGTNPAFSPHRGAALAAIAAAGSRMPQRRLASPPIPPGTDRTSAARIRAPSAVRPSFLWGA